MTSKTSAVLKANKEAGHGNLIGFLSKAQHSGPIKGNIKKHSTSSYHSNAKVTYLNYVQGVK